MKVKLNVLERLTIGGLMPEAGSFANLKLVREAKESLSFTEKEFKEYELTSLPNGSIQWANDSEKSIELGDVVVGLLREALKKLDEEEALEARHVSIYEKLIV